MKELRKPYYKVDGQEIMIRLLYTELKYDIDFITWKTAQSIEDGKQKFEMQTDEESADWIVRSIDEAVNAIKKSLKAYLPHRSRMRTNECEKRDSWDIHLIMEPGWQGDAECLAVLMHRYVVDYVASQWYSMVKDADNVYYNVSADDTLSKIVDEARACDIEGVMFHL